MRMNETLDYQLLNQFTRNADSKREIVNSTDLSRSFDDFYGPLTHSTHGESDSYKLLSPASNGAVHSPDLGSNNIHLAIMTKPNSNFMLMPSINKKGLKSIIKCRKENSNGKINTFLGNTETSSSEKGEKIKNEDAIHLQRLPTNSDKNVIKTQPKSPVSTKAMQFEGSFV